ncbi:hypothetical protein CDD83_9163 [Cordyceps sp. RAO-2017]|nr:hypothetical protein CDD83_9163 [Cordyceps sp. RAO-2017]
MACLTSSTLLQFLMYSTALGHGVILAAQGLQGSPASVGFQVDPSIARDCTGISPCQQDTTIIRNTEIDDNVVNQCGRTQLKGNIDVGENTENALAAGQVTQVKAGSQIELTMHQVNADGAGPYECDLDEASNTGIISQNLSVLNNVPGINGLSQAKTEAFKMTVQMPDQLKCTGASTGNVCTVRCRNNAAAGPFGGCFAVQQVDTEPTKNTPANIKTANSLQDITKQVAKNQKDLPTAVKANENAHADQSQQNLEVVDALLQNKVVTQQFPQQTQDVALGRNNQNNQNNQDNQNNQQNNQNNQQNNQNNRAGAKGRNRNAGGGGGGGGGNVGGARSGGGGGGQQQQAKSRDGKANKQGAGAGASAKQQKQAKSRNPAQAQAASAQGQSQAGASGQRGQRNQRRRLHIKA